MKKPEDCSSNEILDFSSKKVRRLYGIKHEHWFISKKISQAEYKKSENNFEKLASVIDGDLETIEACLESSRQFIQINFRNEDPSSHVNKLKYFWAKPNGLLVLNLWFEWLVGGSDTGSLKMTLEENIDRNMVFVERFLVEKNSENYVGQLKIAKQSLIEKYGNNTMYYLHLLRELCKIWNNDPGKVFFVVGEDSLQQLSTQPYLHIVSVNQLGEADHSWKLVISVRVGGTVIFEDVTMGEGLAAILQVTFAFNLLYDKSVDDMYNFLQRILAKFGPADGARNEKNKLKKNFNDFLCSLGKMVVELEKGKENIASLL